MDGCKIIDTWKFSKRHGAMIDNKKFLMKVKLLNSIMLMHEKMKIYHSNHDTSCTCGRNKFEDWTHVLQCP